MLELTGVAAVVVVRKEMEDYKSVVDFIDFFGLCDLDSKCQLSVFTRQLLIHLTDF